MNQSCLFHSIPSSFGAIPHCFPLLSLEMTGSVASALQAMFKAHRLASAQLETAKLVATYPPKMMAMNKKLLHGIACPTGAVHKGTLRVGRYALALAAHGSASITLR
jgi:hypothetical protein